MHILHITNDFGGTEVYKNLYQHLDKLGVKQTVFVPVNPRVNDRVGVHDFEFSTEGSSIVYSKVQKMYHRYFYENKIKVVANDLMKKIDLSKIDLIHTGTLAMTGAVAYEINKIFHIPFIVSIRDTDINSYYKKMWWKRFYFSRILIKAQRVIFISPQYKKTCFQKHFNSNIVKQIKDKTVVIPNGISQFFLDKSNNNKKTIVETCEIVFAGTFSSRKNLVRLIKAVELLNKEGVDVNLTAIGDGMPMRKVSQEYLNEIYLVSKDKPHINLKKYMDKNELCEDYKNKHIFALPSITETFGLVYVEALSQGLPILYTKSQGFDGFYKDGFVGKSVNALDIKDIAEGIKFIISNYDEISLNVESVDLNKDFNWKKIALKYKHTYEDIIEFKS